VQKGEFDADTAEEGKESVELALVRVLLCFDKLEGTNPDILSSDSHANGEKEDETESPGPPDDCCLQVDDAGACLPIILRTK